MPESDGNVPVENGAPPSQMAGDEVEPDEFKLDADSGKELDSEGNEVDLRTPTEIRSELLGFKPPTKKAGERKKIVAKVHVWLPLAFPPVPEKGSFDVMRLKQSRYFFH